MPRMNRVVQGCVALIAGALLLSGCDVTSVIPMKSNPGPTIDAAPPEPPPNTRSPSKASSSAPSSPTAALSDVFAKMPPQFSFASGVGAWSTDMNVYEDGTFAGYFHDSDMGDVGPDYPNGTMYESLFSGSFVVVRQVGQYEYLLKMTSLKAEGTVGAERIEKGVRIVTSGPSGFEDADEFNLYLPGRKTADLPPDFLDWVSMPLAWGSISPTLPIWGLYNINGQRGFFGVE